jgi:hypothetical protein
MTLPPGGLYHREKPEAPLGFFEKRPTGLEPGEFVKFETYHYTCMDKIEKQTTFPNACKFNAISLDVIFFL